MSELLDFAKRLQTAGVGTLWTDVFVGRRPKTPDKCVTLQTYGGDPNRLLDADNRPADERIAVNVMTRAANQADAETLARSAFDALSFRHFTGDSGDRYAWGRATSMPAYIGTDENDRVLVGFNFTARRHGL